MEDRSKKAISLFNKHAVGYATKFANLEKYHNGFDVLISQLPENALVLDMACGPGNIANYLLTKRPDLSVLGIDLAPKMIEIASKNNPKAEFEVWDMMKVKQLKQIFDAVFIGFGLPYISQNDSQALFTSIYESLADNGLLYASFISGDQNSEPILQQSSDGKDEMLIHFHHPGTIEKSMENLGFKLIWKAVQPCIENDVKKHSDCILIAQK